MTVKGGKNPGRKVAYFAGCTGKYLFPEVPKAVVEVFQHNGFEVYFPDQKCCGMPPFLEGDRQVTLDFVRFNVEHLAEVVGRRLRYCLLLPDMQLHVENRPGRRSLFFQRLSGSGRRR